MVGVKNEQKLHQVRKFLIDNGIQHVHFYEADMSDELTALATEAVPHTRRKLFKKYQLYKAHQKEHGNVRKRYTVKYPDGYYRYMGECGNTPHRTHSLEHATYYDDAESAKYYAGDSDGEVVEVHVAYRAAKRRGGGQ